MINIRIVLVQDKLNLKTLYEAKVNCIPRIGESLDIKLGSQIYQVTNVHHFIPYDNVQVFVKEVKPE